MSMLQVELVLDARATLGEGPCWDERSGLLYWVDIAGKRVHAYNPVSGTNRSVQLDQMVGAAVVREAGGLVLAMERGFYTLDWESEELAAVADPEPGKTGNRFNDGKCDAAGRFWAGTMDKQEKSPTGALYCLEPDAHRTVRKAVEHVTVSNGLGWSPDGRTMYYTDSMTKRVVAYDFDLATGTLANCRTAVTIPADGGFPDGMTVDAEGMLWIAQWGGWQVSRWSPHTGELLTAIPVPVERASSCAFGGPDLDELYITTARIGATEEELAKQPHAGSLFRVKPGVSGLPTYRYRG